MDASKRGPNSSDLKIDDKKLLRELCQKIRYKCGGSSTVCPRSSDPFCIAVTIDGIQILWSIDIQKNVQFLKKNSIASF